MNISPQLTINSKMDNKLYLADIDHDMITIAPY